MNSQITKRQHQVPQFYIKMWADSSNQIYLYDLNNKRSKLTGSKSILFEEFFYEEDLANPDNRIENLLGEIESESAPIIKELNEIVKKISKILTKKSIRKRNQRFSWT